MVPVPKPWILKTGEILNKLRFLRQLSPWLEFKVFLGRKKLHTGKENKKGCKKDQMLED